MNLLQCLMSKGKSMLFLQGLKHVDDDEVFAQLKRIEKKYSKKDFLIIREQIDFSDLPSSYSEEIENIIDFFDFISESYKDSDEDSGTRYEKMGFEVEDHHHLIDAPGYEYLIRLEKEGFKPETRLFKFFFEHKDDYRKTTDEYVLSRHDEFGNWEDLIEYTLSSLGVKSFTETMQWREISILDQVIDLLSKNGKNNAALFYGQYHIPGFVTILQSKDWEIVDSKNLKPRE